MSTRLLLLLFMVMSTWLGAAHACSANPPSGDASSLYTGGVSFNVSAESDLPVGAIIASARSSWSYVDLLNGYPDCNLSHEMKIGTRVSDSSDIYTTGIQGVGIEGCSSSVEISSFAECEPTRIFKNPANISTAMSTGIYTTGYGYYFLVKTGPISGGFVGIRALGEIKFVNEVIGRDQLDYISITAAGCSVSTPTVNVNLGDFQSTDFSGVGYRTNPVAVPISLQCNPGTNISAVITADSDSDTTESGVIKLSATSGSASGIGIQLLNSVGGAVPLNKKITLRSPDSTGGLDFNWTANYIQTKPQVTPGTGNASATITLTYQ